MPTATLKAFRCHVEDFDHPDISWGKTAGKARYALFSILRDTVDDVRLTHISAKRAPEYDIYFPPLPEVAAELSERDRETILHAYGSDEHLKPSQWGYREHYCTNRDNERLLNLVRLGLFTGPHGPGKQANVWSGAFFYLTDKGKELARALIGERECGTPR